VVDEALAAHAANERAIVGLLSPADRDDLVRLLRSFHIALDTQADDPAPSP